MTPELLSLPPQPKTGVEHSLDEAEQRLAHLPERIQTLENRRSELREVLETARLLQFALKKRAREEYEALGKELAGCERELAELQQHHQVLGDLHTVIQNNAAANQTEASPRA